MATNNIIPKNARQPIIAKYVQPYRNGIQPQTLHRNAIGYVIRGHKHIYNGDRCQEINKGDVFYLATGNHYIEDIPEEGKTFEQIVFYYDTPSLNKILNNLNLDYNVSITNGRSHQDCRGMNVVSYPAWATLRNFFTSINQYIKDDMFENSTSAESIKFTELIYLIISNDDCCIKNKVLSNLDSLSASFERTVHEYIFKDVSIEYLAQTCNKSTTSFKKEFKRHFIEPPHKWFVKQRLMHSRMLLVSTNKSVSEIGIECNFPNTSHFIKLFKKEFGTTPVSYRQSNGAYGRALSTGGNITSTTAQLL